MSPCSAVLETYLSSSQRSSSSSSLPASSTSAPSPSTTAGSDTSHHNVNVGAIVGPVVAVVVVLIAFILGILFWRRHRSAGTEAHEATIPAPWFGGYDSPSRDPEKSGANTLSMPSQPFSASSATFHPEPAAYEPYRGSESQPVPQMSTTQLSSAPGSQVRALPSPPVPSSQQSAESQSAQHLLPQNQGVDVDAIIELIAQRIDRSPVHPSVSPPQYPQ